MSRPTNPFRELERRFKQIQENLEQAGTWWESEPFPGEHAEATSVNVDLEDREADLVLTAELPGFDRDDIDVKVTDRTLRIEAEHESESEEEVDGELIRRERHRASVARSIPLPETVDTDDITATYNNGILTVEMPKRHPVTEGTRIEVT